MSKQHSHDMIFRQLEANEVIVKLTAAKRSKLHMLVGIINFEFSTCNNQSNIVRWSGSSYNRFYFNATQSEFHKVFMQTTEIKSIVLS